MIIAAALAFLNSHAFSLSIIHHSWSVATCLAVVAVEIIIG